MHLIVGPGVHKWVVGIAMVPFEKAMVVSYRLFIVTIALSPTIRPQLVVECL